MKPLPKKLKAPILQAWVIIRTAWQRNLNYRVTVLTYRIGEAGEVLILILMWSAIYSAGGGTIKGFSLNEMLSYILIGNICSVLSQNYLVNVISKHIHDGSLSMFLVKPLPYIYYVLVNEIGRIMLTMSLSLLSMIVVSVFFLHRLVINSDWRYLVIITSMIFFSFIIQLLISFLVGAIAFWTDEVDGIQASIDRIRRFFAGGYFPLSLLPATFITISTYLPFQYSFFTPASLYLRKITLAQGLQGIIIELVWIVLLAIIIRFVWTQGLRKYEATGS